ncbi:MAG: MerR family transcriptional regulator [Acidimicrobiia bacterium]
MTSVTDAGWRIDDLAHESGVTVDTIRYYQRQGLLPPAVRSGRVKLYGREHLEQLHRIRDLRARRFSLAAIRALLDKPSLTEGLFADDDTASYSFGELVQASGVERGLADDLRGAGVLRDPADFGRDGYDGRDLDLLRAVAELRAVGLPEEVVAALGRIYARGVEAMQRDVFELFTGKRGGFDADSLESFQASAAASSTALLPLIRRVVDYVHTRTIQRLTLGAIGATADPGDD